MTTTIEQSIQKSARKMSEQFEQIKRTDGTEIWTLKRPEPQWMKEVCHKAHPDGRLPDDSVYEVIYETVNAIAEADPEEDAQKEAINLEADVYTAQLTGWLAEHLGNVDYLTQALDEGVDKDGVALLSYAQYLFKREVADLVYGALKDQADKGA